MVTETQSIIEELRECKLKKSRAWSGLKQMMDYIDDLEHATETAREELAMYQWVSLKDEAPLGQKKVNVRWTNPDGTKDVGTGWRSTLDKEWWIDGLHSGAVVTHWCLIPEWEEED